MGPAIDKLGVRESFAKVIFSLREEWPLADKGILINHHVKSKRPLGKISAADLYAMSLYKISTRGVLARSLYKISIRGLFARSLYEVSVKGVYKSSLGKTPVRDPLATHLHTALGATSLKEEVSWQDLFERSPRKLSIRALLARSRQEISWQDLCTNSL